MQATPGRAPGPSSARAAARAGWLGLIQLATAPDPIPAWRSWPRRQLQAVYAGLALVTLILVIGTLTNGPTDLGIVSSSFRPVLRGVQDTSGGMTSGVVLL